MRVQGGAAEDADFAAGGDQVRYRIALPDGVHEVRVSASLLYQTIGYRWAKNLEAYDAYEARRFGGYFREHADASAVVLARAER